MPPAADAVALQVRLPSGRGIVVQPGFDRRTLLDLVATLEWDTGDAWAAVRKCDRDDAADRHVSE